MLRNLKYTDKTLLITSLILFIIGLIMVFSASNVTAYMSREVSPYYYVIRQAIFIAVGLLIFTPIIFNMKSSSIGGLSWLGILACIPLLIYLIISNDVRSINEANSWIDIGPFNLQPSELVKILTVFWLASYYHINHKRLNRWGVVLFPIVVCIFVALLIFKQPDLGTAIIYSIIVAAMFFSVPVSPKIKLVTKTLFIGFIVLIFLFVQSGAIKHVLNERQMSRIENYKDPCANLLNEGNQVCNGYIAINNGGLTGVGLGKSTQKYLYLPEPYTDFIFPVLIEELGLITGIIVIILFGIILYKILAIGRKATNNASALMCYGVAIYIFAHIAVNLGTVLGLIPNTGVPLPFMSYGGSFTICLIIALAVVQRVAIENKKSKVKD